MKNDHKITLNDLWWMPAVVPLLLIITSFLMGGWYWGLMDDQTMLSQQGSVIERTVNLCKWLLSSGRFVPSSCFHWALLYKIFASSPTGFFIFRWFEGVIALGIWGFFIIDVTGKKWSAWLFIAIAMGFSKLYDGFYYLSIPELLGILLAGGAILFFFRAVKPSLDEGKNINWKLAALSLLFVLLSVGAKETFFVVAAALGFTTLLFSFKKKNTISFLTLALGLLFFAGCYILIVKLFVMRAYSADYQMTNISKLLGNMRQWLQQDLTWHTPWIIISVILLIFGGKPVMQNASNRFALVLSILLYLGYSIILLPWSTGGHYSLPLGIFFALIITMLIVNQLERINGKLWSVIFSAMLCFNIYVSSSAIQWHRSYQIDTKNLVTWIAQNLIFEHDMMNGTVVRINCSEPGSNIPLMVEKLYGKKYKNFIFTTDVGQVLIDPNTQYYLWGVYWGNQDLRRLGPRWTPVFISDHWVMLRRMF